MLFEHDPDAAERYPYMHQYTNYMKKMERPLIGREHEKQLIQAAMLKPELCNVLLLAEAGCGKAQPNDMPVPVADARGYVPIGDLRPGDFVFDENGIPTEVLGVFPQGMQRCFEVGFKDGTVSKCNDQHLWNARRRSAHHEGGSFNTHTLRDMIDRDIIRIGRKKGRKGMLKYMWYVPVNKAVQRSEANLPFDPYALGALIGDGCLTEPCLAMSTSDEAVVAKVADAAGAVGYARRHENNYTWDFFADMGEDGGNRRRVKRPDLSGSLGQDTVFGLKSPSRRIPREYMAGSVSQRMALLNGLMDTDGTVTGSGGRVNVSFATNSPGLADDVRELAASLGYRTSMRSEIRNDGVHDGIEYSVYFIVSDAGAKELFTLERHIDTISAYARNDKKYHKIYDDMAIAYVRDLGYDCEMTCIYVSASSHLYQTGHEHIVTHNTALVQGIMVEDTARIYLEVDLPKMLTNLRDTNEMADRLKTLFTEVSQYRNDQKKDIVLFIDEFHQIVQLSSAAVEVLKPMLADSGTRGIRFIAATTQIEYQQWIAPNLPLVERLQRIRLAQPGEDVVVSILASMCKRYNVIPATPELFSEIYTYTNRYIPSTSQPRKSILILDTMIGWHRLLGRPLDRKLLADVIYETEGINVAFRVDAAGIKRSLDSKVLAQEVATSSIEQRMQICVAGLNNPNRPMSSFLFCGSTGVGKANICSTKIPVWTPDGSVTCRLAGDIVPGDYIFDRCGRPTKVLGVFPQGKRDVYRVTLGDGRYLDVSDNHLWAVFPAWRSREEGYTIYSTQTLLNKGLVTTFKGRKAMKYVIPMNQAVEWPERNFDVDPYVIGALIGDGSLSYPDKLELSSSDEFVINKVASLLDSTPEKLSDANYDWQFRKNHPEGNRRYVYQDEILKSYPTLYHVKSPDRSIPATYMTGSVSQRWALVNGLFDTDGTICQSDGDRFNISFSTHSEKLAYQVQELLYSLGVSSSVSKHERPEKNPEYDVHVCSRNKDKWRFFTLPRHLEAAKKACGVNKQREKMFDYVGIRSIEPLGYQDDMVCFYVDNDEHLYQAGDFIVTHNTEATKQLAKILYDDDRNLIRFDMTEFALPDSLNRFRRELTNRVSAIPYCLILLDEIEKACAPVTRVLLQVLDDGRLMDENEREVTFKNAYIIVTTNSGAEVFQTISNYSQSDKADAKMLEKYDKLLRESILSQSGSKFPPELLGRIDCIVPFQPLSRKTMTRIINMKLESLAKTVKQKHGVTIRVHKDLYPYMIFDRLDTDSNSGGARIVVSKLEREVTVPLSRYINEHPQEKEVFISIGGEMAVRNKRMVESEAYVYVGPKFLNPDRDFMKSMREAGEV